MALPIVVDGFKVTFTPPETVPGTAQIVKQQPDPVQFTTLNSKVPVVNATLFMVQGYVGGNIASAGVTATPFSFQNTVENVKVEGNPVIVQNDTATVTLSGTDAQGIPTTIPNVVIQITNAGQQYVKAQ